MLLLTEYSSQIQIDFANPSKMMKVVGFIVGLTCKFNGSVTQAQFGKVTVISQLKGFWSNLSRRTIAQCKSKTNCPY